MKLMMVEKVKGVYYLRVSLRKFPSQFGSFSRTTIHRKLCSIVHFNAMSNPNPNLIDLSIDLIFFFFCVVLELTMESDITIIPHPEASLRRSIFQSWINLHRSFQYPIYAQFVMFLF